MNDFYHARKEQLFPRLAAVQLARLERHGKKVGMASGEVFVKPGERFGKMLVVLSGSIEIIGQPPYVANRSA